MVVKSQRTGPPKSPKHSGLGIIVICPDVIIFQFPIYLEPLAPRQTNISGNVTRLDPWFQIYGERTEDEGPKIFECYPHRHSTCQEAMPQKEMSI